jgi:ankyrin repeat protein
MARLLLEHGADVVQYDKLDRPSHSAIHAAQSAEMVQLLLDHHADPDQRLGNFSPLHYYARWDHIEAMRAVLRNSVKVDPAADKYAPTPLYYAARRNIDTVKLLLEHGADVKRKVFRWETPLHPAAENGKTDVVRILLERWPEGTREKNRRGYTTLHMAAWRGKIEVVRLLVESWPEGKDALNDKRQTPLSMFEQRPLLELELLNQTKEFKEIIGLLGGVY